MAQWSKNKVSPSQINNGNEYTQNDALSLEAINAIVNNSFYASEHTVQVLTMPTASQEYLNKIVEYVGTTDENYINGYFYQCVENSGVYSWTQKDVQPAPPSITIDSALSTISENPVQNKVVTSALNGKQNTIDASHKLSADYLQDGSTNKAFSATEQTKLNGIESGAQVNTVTSVNTKTGAVVLDADDIDDSSTLNKFVTSEDIINWDAKSTVSVSSTGTATDEVEYITINGVEKKLKGGAGGIANGVAYEIV